jgi:soluble lytic murein transglycosylase-like protein
MRGTSTLLSLALLITPAFAGQELSSHEYSERCVEFYAREYGISPELVRAVIQVESNWQPGIVSPKGAMGLMQLMPETVQRFGVSHPFWIHENVRAGVAYISHLHSLFRGDLRLVLAAYVGGEEPIRSRGLSYSSAEVYNYVQLVASRYRAELQRKGRR